MTNPNRLLFNWSTAFVKNNLEILNNYREFQHNWTLPTNTLDEFLNSVVDADSSVNLNEAKKDSSYLKIMLKSEIAGAKWGRNELWGVRIATDSQLITALKHFNEADAFLTESN